MLDQVTLNLHFPERVQLSILKTEVYFIRNEKKYLNSFALKLAVCYSSVTVHVFAGSSYCCFVVCLNTEAWHPDKLTKSIH